MTQTFPCPTCGADIDAPGGGEATLRCPICHNSVVVPVELRMAGGMDAPGKDLAQAQVQAQIRALLQQGKKIEAIKLYRQTYNPDLLTAKNAVEAFERGEALPAGPPRGMDAQGNMQEVLRLVQAGQKIVAIKLFREITGVGLKEAKDAVEAMERGHPLSENTPRKAETTSRPSVYNALPVEPVSSTGASPLSWVIVVVLFLIILGIGLAILYFSNSTPNDIVGGVSQIGQSTWLLG